VETARTLIQHILNLMAEDPARVFYLAFSGGNTPSLMFDLWANEFRAETPWKRMRIYWVDERCVPSDDSESNYGNMRRIMLEHVPISDSYIYPILGANVPAHEAVRYSKLVECGVPVVRGIPTFDIVLLGVGEDGHTASIFPGQEEMFASPKSYEVSINPHTLQQRITMTPRVILGARRVIFLVAGRSKQSVVHDILSSGDITPSAYIAHHASNVELFTDVSD
jgi:6-phosphogluconolactonase